MYGGDAGGLVVTVYENLIPVKSQSYIGSQGQQWNQGSLDLGAKVAGQYYVSYLVGKVNMWLEYVSYLVGKVTWLDSIT